MTSVVLAALAGMGAAEHFTTVAEALRGQGHRVSVVTADPATEVYRRLGFEVHPVRERPMPQLLSALPPLLARAQQLLVRVQRNVIEPLPEQWEVVRGVIASTGAEAVVTDPLFLGASMLAVRPRESRPAVIMLGGAAPWIPDPLVPPYGMGVAPSPNGADLLRTAALRFAASRSLALLSRSFNRSVAETFGVTITGSLLTSPTHADAWAQLSVPRLEYPRRALPSNFRFVGPLHPPPLEAVPSWWSPDEEPPVVAVRAHRTAPPEDLVLPVVEAFGGGAETVIVAGKTRTETEAALGAPVPPNVHFEVALPWSRMIPGRAVVVADGDYLHAQHALRRGIPLVLAGTLETDVETAARVEWAGVGIDLRTRRPSPAAIRDAVRRIHAEPSFRSAAAQIAAQIAKTDAEGAVVRIVEEAVRGHTPTAGASPAR